MISRHAILVTLGLLGAAGAGLSASSVLGAEAVSTVRPTAVSARHAPLPANVLSAKTGKRVKVRYLAVRDTAQPNGEAGGQLKCPKSAPYGVSGVFYPVSDAALGQIVLSNSQPASTNGRTWDIGVRNLSPQPQDFIAGVVCIG